MIVLPNPKCCLTDNPNHLCQNCKAMLRNQNIQQPVRNQITEQPIRNCKCDAVDDPNDYYPDPPVINWSEDSAFNQSPSPQSNPAPSSPELIYNSNPNDEDDYYPDPPIINWAEESAFRP